MYNHNLEIIKRIRHLMGSTFKVDVLDEKFMEDLEDNIILSCKKKLKKKAKRRMITQQMKDRMMQAAGHPIMELDTREGKIIREKALLRKFKRTFAPAQGEEIGSTSEQTRMLQSHPFIKAFAAKATGEKQEEKTEILEQKIEEEIRKSIGQDKFQQQIKAKMKQKKEDRYYARPIFPPLEDMDESKSIKELYDIAEYIVWRRDILGKKEGEEEEDIESEKERQKEQHLEEVEEEDLEFEQDDDEDLGSEKDSESEPALSVEEEEEERDNRTLTNQEEYVLEEDLSEDPSAEEWKNFLRPRET